jgi:tetratricopeptide (TPR) repeat protein
MTARCPYPGLRAFEEEDWDVFFGRTQEIDDLLRCLANNRFFAVLGVSGCGKSSLVRAGLLPVLRTGWVSGLEGEWTIIKLLPGNEPVQALQNAVQHKLERRTNALAEWARRRKERGPILILVDQFEELFRSWRANFERDRGEGACLFVDQILAAAEERDGPVHLVLTMRTDFLGEAAAFPGLVECLNAGSYLVPRLSRLRQEEAILRPANKFGFQIENSVVQDLLNHSYRDPDKLPILQHLLKRLWEISSGGVATHKNYLELGAWGGAVARDAESVLARLPSCEEPVKHAMQWLTDRSPDGRAVRRRRPKYELAAVMFREEDVAMGVISAFEERGFLKTAGLSEECVELTHESLIYSWPKLKQWVDEESENADTLRYFATSARRKHPLTGDVLREAKRLRARVSEFAGWGERYLERDSVNLVLDWIDNCEEIEVAEILRHPERVSATMGSEHPDTVEAYRDASRKLDHLGRYPDAERMVRRALRAQDHIAGHNSALSLTLRNRLADMLQKQGKYEELDVIFSEIRSIRGEVSKRKAQHPDHLTWLTIQANALFDKGDYGSAEDLYRKVLEGRRRALGPEHPKSVNSQSNLARTLQMKGNFAEAEPLHRGALQIRERVLGSEHPDTLDSLEHLAEFLHQQGRDDEAEPFYRRALELRERILGPDHPETLDSVDDLATVFESRNEIDAAEPLYRRALQTRERVRGPQHPDTLTSMNHLAGLLRRKADFTASESLYRRVLKIRETVRGPDHPETATSVHDLGLLLHMKGDLAPAEALYRRALDIRGRILGKGHPETLRSVHGLALILELKGELDQAESLIQRAFDGHKMALPEHPLTTVMSDDKQRIGAKLLSLPSKV